ncbi:MAG TPA: hypothetical protein IAC45_02500 [Candidatus Aphodousia faecavium]|nr:hypothetical protein [Candidatus Aphodousia faecavium]
MSEIVYLLKQSITFEGKTYDSFVLDFDRLTGRNVNKAKKLFDASGGRITPIHAIVTSLHPLQHELQQSVANSKSLSLLRPITTLEIILCDTNPLSLRLSYLPGTTHKRS